MKFSMTGQENGDLLIQVTTWAGLTICEITEISIYIYLPSQTEDTICTLYLVF